MIWETNTITIDPLQRDAFVAAFATARGLLLAVPGCSEVQLLACLEQPARYQIRVAWTSLDAHAVDYPAGPLAPKIRALVLPFVRSGDPVHYAPVLLPD